MKFLLSPFPRKQSYFSYLIAVIALFVIYFSTARIGLSLAAVSRFATLVWLPSGIAVAALFRFGYRLWPGILAGAFLVNLFNGASLFVAIGIGVGNTFEALAGSYLLNRYVFSPAFDHLRDVLFLVLLVMPLSAFISATIGTSSLLLGRVIVISTYYPTWIAWWLGDMISILILTPLLLTWSNWPHESLSIKRLAEIGMLTLCVLVVGLVVFLGFFQSGHKSSPITYLVFPPLIWASLRFGPRGTLAAIFTLSGLAVVGTLRGVSPFSTGSLSESLFLLQSFMGIITVTSLILAAVMAERRAFEQRKDEFISMASHELKTPLTIMQAYTELLHRKYTQQSNQEALLYLSKMASQIAGLSRLIADMLDVSRIQAGKIALAEEAVDVDMLVREIVEYLQLTTAQHQIGIEGEVQCVIAGDKERLGQVLINLITNAMKYSPHAKRIIVHLTHAQETLIVGVQDFGIGIPKGQQQKVFERFYRVKSDQNRTYPGLGIGLYIAHQIIERHAGKMWVESVEGQGSSFFFSLPLPG